MSLLSIGGDGPAAYMGNPALQQMLLAAAMKHFQGGDPANQAPSAPVAASGNPAPAGMPTSAPAGNVGGGLFLRGPSMDQDQPPMQAAPQPPQASLPAPAPGQISAALGALNGSPRVTPPGQAPVMADGSQPLQLSHDTGMQLASTAMHLPDIKARNGINWRELAGIIGPALMGMSGSLSGRPELGLQALELQQKGRQNEADRQLELAKALMQSKLPKTVGNSLVQEGDDGQYHPVYSDPEPFESFAQAQGYTPGTPEYAQAVKNYRLGAWSSDAVGAKEGLMGERFGYQSDLQDARLATSRRNTDVRVNASVGNNIRTTRTTQRGQDYSHRDRQRGQDFQHQDRQSAIATTDSRVRGSASYQGRGGGGRHGFGGGSSAVAVGPNGHQIVVQNGRWVDAQTGQPVQ